MPFEFMTSSPEETIELGKKIGKILKGGDIIAYRGGLGAGKTTMTRGIALGMGLRDDVSSPTFALVNEYSGPLTLCHFDMYRITDLNDLESVGFFDYLSEDRVIVIEWSENISEALPEGTIYIDIDAAGEDIRKIVIEGDERFESV